MWNANEELLSNSCQKLAITEVSHSATFVRQCEVERTITRAPAVPSLHGRLQQHQEQRCQIHGPPVMTVHVPHYQLLWMIAKLPP